MKLFVLGVNRPPVRSQRRSLRGWSSTFRPLPLLAVVALLSASAVSTASAAADEPFYVFRDGAPAAAIVLVGEPPPHRLVFGWQVIPEDVSPDLVRAIDLFRADLRQGYGIDLPLGTDSGLPNRIEIVWESRSMMDEDRTDITFPADHVMRITGGESGIIRTLFHLLEEYGGVRYLFATEPGPNIGFGAHFPERTSLSIPRSPVVRNNAFYPLCRSSGRTTYGSQWPGERNRLYHWQWEARLGAKARINIQHELTQIAFPIEQYMRRDDMPADAMFPILHGARVRPWTWTNDLSQPSMSRAYRHGWQPCFSSRAAEDEAVKNLLAHLRQHPDVQSLTLAVSDNGGHCECADCLALDGGDVNFMGYPNRSESYYRWVNRVVERVTAEFPEVRFGVLAYREVEEAPSFKMHPNVVVTICMDFQVIMDPEIRAGWEGVVRDWKEAEAVLKVWSYNIGVGYYRLPRLFFPEMQQMLQFFHEQGAVGALEESYYFTAFGGPMHYVFLKLLEDPYLDLEAVIRDWCEAAVGADAAPVLRRHYAFWEDYWRTKATRTTWWNSRRAQYLTMGGTQTAYMLGLEPGDLAGARALMEQVVALAGTHGTQAQRRRADLLMTVFAYQEACAQATGAEYFAPNGTVPDAARAVALLRSLPVAQRAYETAKRLPGETPAWIAPAMASDIPYALPSLPAAAGAWIADPAVRAEFEAQAQNQELEPRLRFLLATMHRRSTGAEIGGNLLPNGDFSVAEGAVGSGPDSDYTVRGVDGWQTWDPVHGRVSRSDDVAFRGSHSLKCEIRHAGFGLLRIVRNVKPETAYYVSARVHVPADQPVTEGRVRFGSTPTRYHQGKYQNLSSNKLPEIVPTAGQWIYLDQVIPGRSLTDSLRLYIALHNFEPGNVVYIDDVTVLEIADPGAASP